MNMKYMLCENRKLARNFNSNLGGGGGLSKLFYKKDQSEITVYLKMLRPLGATSRPRRAPQTPL